MIVTYGAHYSAAELSPAEPGSFTQHELRFLIRYIGRPEIRNAYRITPAPIRSFVSSGRTVLLVIEE